MLSSQRALFDIPADVSYLNAAGWSPLPRATQEAARAAVSRKAQPWKLASDFHETQHERDRLGNVPDSIIRFAKQPVGDAGFCRCPFS